MATVYLETLLVGHEDWVSCVQWLQCPSRPQCPKREGEEEEEVHVLFSTSMDRNIVLWESPRTEAGKALQSGVWLPVTRVGDVGACARRYMHYHPVTCDMCSSITSCSISNIYFRHLSSYLE